MKGSDQNLTSNTEIGVEDINSIIRPIWDSTVFFILHHSRIWCQESLSLRDIAMYTALRIQVLVNLAIQDKASKLLLVDPVNSIDHDQTTKNPPRVAYLELGMITRWEPYSWASLFTIQGKNHLHQEASQDARLDLRIWLVVHIATIQGGPCQHDVRNQW